MFIGHSIADASGRILAMDQKVCDLIHRTGSEVMGLSYVAITHPGDQMRNVARVQQLRPVDAPICIRKRYLRPNGSSIEMDVHVSRMETGTDAGRLLGTLMLPPRKRIAGSPRNLWKIASKCLQFGAIRRKAIGDSLNGDQAWTIMMHAYLAEAEGRTAALGQIADDMGLPVPQVRRWIKALQASDLVEPGVSDQHHIQLSARGLAALESVLCAADALGK